MKLNKSGKDADGGSRGVMVLVLELAVEAAPVVAGGEAPPPVANAQNSHGSNGVDRLAKVKIHNSLILCLIIPLNIN